MKSLDIPAFCRRHWQPLSLYGLLFITLILMLVLKLNSLLPGFSASEVQTYHSSLSLRYIFHHPINAPYTILAWVFIKLHAHRPLLAFRYVSVLLSIMVLAVFCRLLHFWHGRRVALIGTLLFGTSNWFLHTARLGTPEILLFGLVVLVACGVWLQATKSPYAILSLFVLGAALIYVPGMLWLIGLAMLINWKRLDDIFTNQLRVVTIGTIVALAMLSPLAWNIYRTPHIARALLNLPATGWPMPLTVLKNIIKVPLHIFIYGAGNPVTELGHLPIFSVFASVMFIFGAIVYLQHLGLQRTRLFLAILIAASVVVALGGPANISLLIPFLYLITAAGTGYVLDQWFRVFPKNPIARGIGLYCFVGLVFLVISFNLRQYFVSWPNASTTQAVFQAQDIGSPRDFDTIIR